MELDLPPPSQRQIPRHEPRDEQEWALLLLAEHQELLEAVTRRSPTDFEPRARRADDLGEGLADAVARREHVPPSLVATLAPQLVTRIDALAPRLRRRLARTRVELPLSRLRETDPTCLRRNARRPGRTLLEKAGPKQQLTGIRRAPRFDTTENRVLAATARRLARETTEALRSLPATARREGRAGQLRQLALTCEALLARPELEEVGPPRPGERPSNALLGDAHYRAVYRAWRLLRAEESRFASRWASLERVWVEMVLLATWASLDARRDLEPLPTWVRTSDAPQEGARVRTAGSVRRWLQHGPSVRLVCLHDDGATIRLEVCSVGSEPETLAVSGPELSFPADRERALEEAKSFLALLDDGTSSPRRATREWNSPGIDLLGTIGVVCTGGQAALLGPAGWAMLPNPDDEPIDLVGRAATWRDDVQAAALEPRALGAQVDALPRRGTAAVVVPDSWDDLALADMRRRAGRCWAVWRPVALALAVATDGPQWIPKGPDDAAVDVLVLTEGVDGVEVAKLQAAWDEHEGGQPGLVWRRRHPADHVERLLADILLGGWLRGDSLAVRQGRLVRQPHDADGIDRDTLRRAVAAHAGCSVALLMASEDTVRAVRDLLPPTQHRVDAQALARGANVFLQRLQANLPTWVDELPRLEVRAKVGRALDWAPLWSEQRLVRPGQRLEARSDVHLDLPPGQRRVPIPLRRADRDLRYSLVVEGAPLPLERPARVAVHLALTYGMDGISGELRPIERDKGRFKRIAFSLAPSEEAVSSATGPLPPPVFPEVLPIPGVEAAIRQAREALDPKSRRRKGRSREPGAVTRELREHLQRPAFLADRGCVEDLAQLLEWYLGLVRIKKAGKPPRLAAKDEQEVLRCRGRLGVSTAVFRGHLIERLCRFDDAVVEAAALSTELPDATWEVLVNSPIRNGHQAAVWARGVFKTMSWHRDLAPNLGPGGVEQLVHRVVELIGLAESDRHKAAFARLCAVVVWLCGAREAGLVQLEDPGIPELRAELLRLRDALDPVVLDHVERGLPFRDTRPVDSALAYLEGRYDALSEVL